jgi:hypothetical protein
MKKFLYATILALVFSTSLVAQQPTKPPAPTKPAATTPADPKATQPKAPPPAVTVWMQEYHKLEELGDVITAQKHDDGIDKLEESFGRQVEHLQKTIPDGYHFDKQHDGLVENPPTDKTPKDISKSVPAPTPKK